MAAIVEIVTKVGEYVVPPLKRQLNYVCCYSNNIKDLKDEVNKLDDVKTEVKLDVDAARRNLQIIGPRVSRWLLDVERIRENRNDLIEEATKVQHGCMYGMCPNLKLRYVLSRRDKKMTEKSTKLRDEGKFDRVSYPPPPMDMVQYPDPTRQMDPPSYQIGHETVELENTFRMAPFELENRFKSRKYTEERIVDALQDPNVSVIGLCGMGGVGKTTMARKIVEIVKERKMFDEVIMVVVSQQQDCRKIQNSIAEMLGLRLEAEGLELRAIRLRNRIADEGSIFLILDDIRERLDMREIGILTGLLNSPCKVLLTSRARDVCIQMGAQKILLLEVLSLEEAWILFSEEAGIFSEFSHLYAIGKEVAHECKGLPIALLSVARTLKGRSKPSWEDALVQLKRFIPENIIGVQGNVYRPVELSYSHLESAEAKSLFILCSLFQENSNICIEDLVRYGLGLAIFKGIKTLREGRNRALALIDLLKDRFLLTDGYKEGYVKMHDVVYAAVMSIRAKDKHVYMTNGTEGWWSLKNSCVQCTHASIVSSISTMVPTWLNCPNLIFLLWKCNNQKLQDPERTFKKLRALHVLDIHYVDSLKFPASVQELTNLRVLRFYNCKLENISMLGYFVNLEILSLQGSDVDVLPVDLGNLGKLRLLDVTECENLQQIASGVIERLIQLEELYLPNSFQVWNVEELKQLHHLTALRIVIGSRMAVSEKMLVFSKLEEYDISIGDIPSGFTRYHNFPNRDKRSFQKAMTLFLPTSTPLGDWIYALLEKAEYLRLGGNGISSIVLKSSLRNRYLKQLAIQGCKTVEHLETTTTGTPTSFPVLPVLESLFIYQLPNIKEICFGEPPEKSFGELRYLHLRQLATLKHFFSVPMPNVTLSNLKSIYIDDCPNLQSLFCTSVARSLMQLEELEVVDCRDMKLVFADDREDDRIEAGYIEFPKLNKLALKCLHGATSFARVNKISFPQLVQLKMQALPQFEGFCSTKSSFFSSSDDRQLLFNKKVVCPRITRLALESLNNVLNIFSPQQSGFLPNLLYLDVHGCHGLKTIFSPFVASALVKLKELRIRNCKMLVKMIEKENGVYAQTPALFKELEFLEVYSCPKLQSVLPLSVALGLAKLKKLRVISCESLVEVIGNDEQEQMNTNAVLFPRLRTLQLSSLPNVESFCTTNRDLEIPSLYNVNLDRNSALLKTLVKFAKNAAEMIRHHQEEGTESTFYGTAPVSFMLARRRNVK